MAQIHNQIVKDLETKEARWVWYGLRKNGKSINECYKLLDEINYYIDPEAVTKAENLMKNERAATKQLNSFFNFNQ